MTVMTHIRYKERQKATRHVKKARKHLGASELDTPQHAAAQEILHIAEVDLNYTQYCPLDQKYEGIYPRTVNCNGIPTREAEEHGNDGDTEKILASRPAMWHVVETCMRNGTLEALRNGKMTRTLTMRSTKPAATNTHVRGPGGGVMINFGAAPEATKPDQPQKQDDSDKSDGGFFEK